MCVNISAHLKKVTNCLIEILRAEAIKIILHKPNTSQFFWNVPNDFLSSNLRNTKQPPYNNSQKNVDLDRIHIRRNGMPVHPRYIILKQFPS